MIRNQWYVVLDSRQVRDRPIERTKGFGLVGAAAPGLLGAVLIAWLACPAWRRVLFVPDLACPSPRMAS